MSLASDPRTTALGIQGRVLLISNGEQPLAVSRQLGHSSIAITMDRYSHIYPEGQDRLAETLDEVFQRVQAAQAAPVVPLRN
jgi:integrase